VESEKRNGVDVLTDLNDVHDLVLTKRDVLDAIAKGSEAAILKLMTDSTGNPRQDYLSMVEAAIDRSFLTIIRGRKCQPTPGRASRVTSGT